MAKSKLKRLVAPAAEEDFLRVPHTPLSLEDRTALRAMFASTAFKRAWHNAQLSAPGCLPPGDLNGPQGGVIANNRLHQQQGWEMFKAALLREIQDPTPPKSAPRERWSEAGMQIVDPKDVPAPSLAKLSTEKLKK